MKKIIFSVRKFIAGAKARDLERRLHDMRMIMREVYEPETLIRMSIEKNKVESMLAQARAEYNSFFKPGVIHIHEIA